VTAGDLVGLGFDQETSDTILSKVSSADSGAEESASVQPDTE
jgi:hypothetical protein